MRYFKQKKSKKIFTRAPRGRFSGLSTSLHLNLKCTNNSLVQHCRWSKQSKWEQQVAIFDGWLQIPDK